uniref:Agenet domain-containing protein n=1 Tax=Setaria italica TaxID=4555 RepID=K3ZNP1_SETIT
MVQPRPRKRGRPRTELGGGEAEAVGEDGEDPAVLFPLGALVEVRSDDSGFAGSFYEATVAGYQRSGLGYVVTYATLSRSKDGGSPLRELAAAADVRPRPPPSPPRGFAPHEMVEAFHNDGWWAGVVCAVPTEAEAAAGRRVYKVCFPTSREMLEFEETALRPNRVFRGERWIPAAEVESGTPLFRDGIQVEVSRSAKTFGKYWSPAIILKVIGATSFLVQYRDAREDGEQVTEILDSQYIRPTRNIIHMDSKYRFLPSSHVEVFHEGSWWTGAVSEVLDNESTKKYVVKINNEEADMDDVECVDLLTVDHTQLRPKYNWYRGKWVRCLTEKPGNRGPQLKPRKRPISAALESSGDSVELTASGPCIDSEDISDEPGSYLKDKGNDEDVVLKQVCPEFLVRNENDQIKHMPSSFPERVVKQQNTVLSFESHLTVPSQSSVTGFHSLKYDPKLCLSGQLELSSSRVITMPSVPQTGQLQASLFGAFGQLRPLPQGPIFGMQSHTIDFSSIVGSEKTFTDQGKQANYKCGYLMTGSKQKIKFGSFSGTDLARKRLFTDKFHQEDYIGAAQHGATKVSVLTEKSVLSMTSTLNNPGEAQVLLSDSSTQCGKEAANAEESAIIMEQGTSEEYCQQYSVMNDDANVHLLPSAESCKDTGDKDNNKAMVECVPTDDVSSMGGGVAPNLLPSSENYEDGKDAMVGFAAEASESMESSEITQLSSIGICNSSEAEQGDTLIDPKDSEHTPMSKYAPSRTQGSCLSLSQRSLDAHESIMAVHGTEPLASMNLPFMKTSSLWEQIEAMEVFRNMPQRPNFHKFQQHVPELREGMALGLMLSFANLAESIRRLSIHDEDALFKEKMKGLCLLEADGFDVRHLRSRLETLVHIRSSPAVLQGAIKDLEKKISHKVTDDRHLGAQIRVLNMTVRHLEVQAYLFRCITQSAVSQKMNIASEIGRLKTEAGTLERSYLSAEQSFSNAAAAPW